MKKVIIFCVLCVGSLWGMKKTVDTGRAFVQAVKRGKNSIISKEGLSLEEVTRVDFVFPGLFLRLNQRIGEVEWQVRDIDDEVLNLYIALCGTAREEMGLWAVIMGTNKVQVLGGVPSQALLRGESKHVPPKVKTVQAICNKALTRLSKAKRKLERLRSLAPHLEKWKKRYCNKDGFCCLKKYRKKLKCFTHMQVLYLENMYVTPDDIKYACKHYKGLTHISIVSDFKPLYEKLLTTCQCVNKRNVHVSILYKEYKC